MKNIWLWIVLAVGGLFLWSKSKTASAAQMAAAGQNIVNNPLSNFWSPATAASAKQSAANVTAAVGAFNSIGQSVGSAFGGPSTSSGAASPSTAGSGAGGPSQAQVDAVSSGTPASSSPSYGGSSADSFGSDGTDYGVDDTVPAGDITDPGSTDGNDD